MAPMDKRQHSRGCAKTVQWLWGPTHAEADCWTLLVNDLCMQAVRDKKLVLRSSGIQQRDFITLQDVGRVVSHFLDFPATALRMGYLTSAENVL